jgi:hypothetical protein
MIPECTGGGDGHGHGSATCSADADRRRHHAVGSTLAGAVVVFIAWQALTVV